MTWSDVRNYVLAALLLLASVPLYRYIIARGHEGDMPPGLAPSPVVVQSGQVQFRSVPSPRQLHYECIRGTIYRQDSDGSVGVGGCPDGFPPLPLQLGTEGGVRCWGGTVYRQTQHRWEPVFSAEGLISRCEIQAEPVRPDSSPAND